MQARPWSPERSWNRGESFFRPASTWRLMARQGWSGGAAALTLRLVRHSGWAWGPRILVRRRWNDWIQNALRHFQHLARVIRLRVAPELQAARRAIQWWLKPVTELAKQLECFTKPFGSELTSALQAA